MDQARVGRMKLYVNIPRYRRAEQERTIYQTKDKEGKLVGKTNEERTRYTHEQRVRSNKEEWRGNKGKEKMEWRVSCGKQTYTGVVKKSPQGAWKGTIIETKQVTLPWMSNNAVGFFVADLSYNQLCEEFIVGGMNMVKVRYLGDNMALLTPTEGERMEDVIGLNKLWFESFFEAIEPWTDACVVGHKITWVRCYGLPISLWNKDYFFQVVSEVASLVDIDKATEAWDNLEYARLQVRLLKSCSARLAKGMKINDQVYNICIEEEQPYLFGEKCKCTFNHYASSDSMTSSKSFVEESMLSEKSDEEMGMYVTEEVRRPTVVVESGKDGSPHKTKKSNIEEWSAQCNCGQEISGSVYTNKEKEKLVEQVGELAISLAHLVNVACRSNSVQVALTNFLVAMEASSGAKSNKGMGHEGSAKEAHNERGVHILGKEVGPNNDMFDQIAIMPDPVRIGPTGIGESVLSSSARFVVVDDEGRPGWESNAETTSAEHECVKRSYTTGGEGVNGHSSSISEKGDKRQSQCDSDECCSRVDSESTELGGEEAGINIVKNPRRRRQKGLWELGEPSTC